MQVALISGVVLSILACALEGERNRHPDPYAYASAIGEVLDGKQLYGEIWQDKPPLGLLAYVVPQLFARGSSIALGVWLGIVLALQALLVMRTLGRDHREAATATALVLVLAPSSRYEIAWLSTDHLANLGVLGLLAIAWRIYVERAWTVRRVLAAGAIAAACFLVRQTSVVFVVPVVAAIWWCPQSRGARAIAICKLGAASAGAFVIALLACLPIIDLQTCLYTMFVYPMRYAASTDASLGGLLVYELEHVFIYAAFVLLLAAIASQRWRAVLAVALCAVAATALPRKGYLHYTASLLPMVAFTTFVVVEMTPRYMRSLAWAFIAWLGIASTARTVSLARDPLGNEHHTVERLIASVDRIAKPGDTILFAVTRGDSSYMYFAAGVPSASPFYLPYQIDNYQGTIMPIERERIIEGYRANPPTIIVLDTQDKSSNTTRPLVNAAAGIAHRPPFVLVESVERYRIFRR